MQVNGSLTRFAQLDVQRFDEERERHREVDVALWNVELQGFGNETHSNQQQKAQGEHLDCRMLVDEATHCSGENEHETDSYYYGRNHYADVVYHSYRSDDGVE